MRRISIITAMLLAFPVGACGESDVNTAACGAIGSPCDDGCEDGHECIRDVCVPVRGECGGFVGAACTNASLTCTYPKGNSGGVCMLPDEHACVCAIAPGTFGGCEQDTLR
jgi:hypothetical protein